MNTEITQFSLDQNGFLYFVRERENLRLNRAEGLPPEQWTADPILRKYKFTNIRRRDDRVSQWFIKHLIKPYEHLPHLWFTLAVARLINWPPTLQALLDAEVLPCRPEEFNADRFVAVIEGLRGVNRTVYGSAYMLYPTKKNPGGKKSRAVAEHIIGDLIKHAPYIDAALWAQPAGEAPRIELVVEQMSKAFGISTFMAGQAAADLTYATGHLDCAADLYTYAPIGPGSARGLNYMLRRPEYSSWKQWDFNSTLIELNRLVVDYLDIPDLTLHDVQNCCCEFSKYARAFLGTGSPKQLFKPTTEF